MKQENLTKNQILNWYSSIGIKEIYSNKEVPLFLNAEKEIIHDQFTKILTDNMKKEEPAIVKLIENTSNTRELRELLMHFDGCNLKKTAQNTVFSEGAEQAEIMLIGEAPGAKEDEEGRPFCGDSGELLDNIFKSIGFSRDKNLYITNSVFWRPPANRRPTEEEINICLPFLEKQISLVKPKILVLVGSTAVYSVMNLEISEIKGKFLTYKNKYMLEEIKVTAIFHPAYLLRQPSRKKETWYEALSIKETLLKL